MSTSMVICFLFIVVLVFVVHVVAVFVSSVIVGTSHRCAVLVHLEADKYRDEALAISIRKRRRNND